MPRGRPFFFFGPLVIFLLLPYHTPKSCTFRPYFKNSHRFLTGFNVACSTIDIDSHTCSFDTLTEIGSGILFKEQDYFCQFHARRVLNQTSSFLCLFFFRHRKKTVTA